MPSLITMVEDAEATEEQLIEVIKKLTVREQKELLEKLEAKCQIQ